MGLLYIYIYIPKSRNLQLMDSFSLYDFLHCVIIAVKNVNQSFLPQGRGSGSVLLGRIWNLKCAPSDPVYSKRSDPVLLVGRIRIRFFLTVGYGSGFS